ncbi:hypothetical protein H2199_001535 [Coniosporium tulheliwenetii]|uniref:Uncharacterized protein n=1 Tax=Coniosporium tulheliwenetii TaxID=3383036 RepID=A0ACC2ZJM8_9PEZI|nr:hypothetical protein H2199_001535 [Cladosporium sp. JES 115]
MQRFQLKAPKGRELLGGDLLAQCLYQLGVRVAFGLHGGHLDAFLMGCVDIGIDLVDTRHETVAVQAAEGYSRASGKVGTCFVTANTLADRSPVFCVTSSAPLRDTGTNALQDFHDQVVLAKNLTKFAQRITNVGEIPRVVAVAWRTATAGAPGPVVVDFPIDILFTPVETDSIAWGAIAAPPVCLPGPNPSAIDEAVRLYRASERPCIIVGTGAQGAVDELLKLAEPSRTPIFHTSKYSTAIPYTHHLRAGLATKLAFLQQQNKPQPDLILLVGVRTGFLLGGRGGAIIPNTDCKLIQIDVDGSEIGRSHHIDVGIVSDASLALSAIRARLASDSAATKTVANEEWIRTALGLEALNARNDRDPVIDEENGRLHPYHALKRVFACIPRDSIVCVDGGECGAWAQQLLEHAHAHLSMATTGYMGFLGNGWGYALGAAVADPDRMVLNIQGDGSAGFHIAELDTYARFGLNILTVVVNNASWGMSRAGQELIFGGQTAARPAVALSEQTREIDAGGEDRGQSVLDLVGHAVEKMAMEKGPGLLNLVVSEKPVHDVTRAMVGTTGDPDVIVVPYYDNLPRPYYGRAKERDRV